jgi:hypothetical protein
MKREFTIPVTTSAYTYEEAHSQVHLMLQIGAFLKDFNASKLAGSFIGHFLLAKVSQLSQGQMDLSSCYNSTDTESKGVDNTPIAKRRKRKSSTK